MLNNGIWSFGLVRVPLASSNHDSTARVHSRFDLCLTASRQRPKSSTTTVSPPQHFPILLSHYRIAELQFADHSAYESYLGWFRDNPIPPERGPAGRTQFGFYVLTDSVKAIRET